MSTEALRDAHVWVRVTVGLFLLLTGALKVHGLLVDPLKSELLGIPSWLQILAIQVEFLLALWLIGGLRSRWALITATGFFALAGSIAVKQVYENQQTCGCFGNLYVNPAYTLALDIIVLVVLATTLYWTPRAQAGHSGLEWLGHIGAYLTILIALIALPGLLGWVDYAEVVRTLRGEMLEVIPRVAEIETTVPGVETTGQIEIKNHGETTVRIVGGSASCGCLVYDELPLEIPPQTTRSFRVSVLKTAGGLFRDRFVLYTNHPNQPTLQAGVTGRVTARGKDVVVSQGR